MPGSPDARLTVLERKFAEIEGAIKAIKEFHVNTLDLAALNDRVIALENAPKEPAPAKGHK